VQKKKEERQTSRWGNCFKLLGTESLSFLATRKRGRGETGEKTKKTAFGERQKVLKKDVTHKGEK